MIHRRKCTAQKNYWTPEKRRNNKHGGNLRIEKWIKKASPGHHNSVQQEIGLEKENDNVYAAGESFLTKYEIYLSFTMKYAIIEHSKGVGLGARHATRVSLASLLRTALPRSSAWMPRVYWAHGRSGVWTWESIKMGSRGGYISQSLFYFCGKKSKAVSGMEP